MFLKAWILQLRKIIVMNNPGHDGISPSMKHFLASKELLRRGMVSASLILASMLFTSMLAKPSVVAEPRSAGIATAGLLLSVVFGGWAFASEKDQSAIVGLAVGMPLGFFVFQNSYARAASMPELVEGSGRVMALAAVLGIGSAVFAWAWRRFIFPRFQNFSSQT